MKRTVLIVCLSTSLVWAHPHNEAVPPTEVHAHDGALTTGTGRFRYQYIPEKLQLPAEAKMKNGHGLCRDGQGNIYFCFEPQEPQGQVLVRFAPDGTGAVLLGDTKLAVGVPHGLNIYAEADGTLRLIHANNAATVHKTTLDGSILWTQTWSPQMGNYKPTDAVVPPGSQRLFVADGYGSHMIHALRTKDGVYDGKSWGGKGSDSGEFNTPHGITFDSRKQLLLVADRGNKRLEYYDLKGKYQGSVQAKEITAPCNVDISGDHALVPNLDGTAVILNGENHAESVLEISKLLGEQGHKHPHDAIWLANGDVVVCTWNPGRLSYWRLLSEP